ncbi:MAG TPA: hypothetical protein VKO43_09090 [Candidatus Krumholzibacteriaceae bacterium]|nr:hypothetical protein [Candidatus Krumholzibacteriaceae bacterium]
MKDPLKNIVSIIVILNVLICCLIIPEVSNARVYIRREELFGAPGEDPNIATSTLNAEENSEITVALRGESEVEEEKISLFNLHMKIIINQITYLLF